MKAQSSHWHTATVESGGWDFSSWVLAYSCLDPDSALWKELLCPLFSMSLYPVLWEILPYSIIFH